MEKGKAGDELYEDDSEFASHHKHKVYKSNVFSAVTDYKVIQAAGKAVNPRKDT